MKNAMRAVLLSAVLLLSACSHSSFDPPERSGPIGLVDTGSGKQAWLATIQEEERSRNVGGGSRSVGKWVTESHYHLRLQAHDPANARRLWLKELKVLRDKDGGMGAEIRILGQQGDVVWEQRSDQRQVHVRVSHLELKHPVGVLVVRQHRLTLLGARHRHEDPRVRDEDRHERNACGRTHHRTSCRRQLPARDERGGATAPRRGPPDEGHTRSVDQC